MRLETRRTAQTLALGVLAALTVTAVLLLVLIPLRILPAEDAVILHLFSRNLAQTGVISFYRGGPPAEGATDFLWMLLLAGTGWTGDATVRTWSNMTDNVLAGVAPDYVAFTLPYVPGTLLQEEPGEYPEYECWFLKGSAPAADTIANILLSHGGRQL